MKQFTVEVTSSEIVHKRHTIQVLAKNWEQAVPKAIHQVREISNHNVVVGDPKKLREEAVEEIIMPTTSSDEYGGSPSL